MFVEGKMPSAIARHLTGQGIPTPAGKSVWQSSTIESMLQNEKYKGDAILQKTFCTDFLTKKMKANEGELPQYYVEQSHPAIIESEVFDEVQHELKRRKNAGYNSRGSCFSSKIVCGECGAFYGPKVWHSTSKYKRTIWQCNRKFKNGKRCSTPHLYEYEIKAAFVDIMNHMMEDKDAITADYKVIIDQLNDTTTLDEEDRRLKDEAEILLEMINWAVVENASKALDQAEYSQRYMELVSRYQVAKNRLNGNECKRKNLAGRREKLTEFIDLLKDGELLTGFNQGLWNSVVESVMVRSNNEFNFIFRDGSTCSIFHSVA